MECELLGTFGGTWSIDTETHLSESERNGMNFVARVKLKVSLGWLPA